MRPVILSGGSGTRLWPLSTPKKPKQFLSLYSESTLFQDTLKRLKNLDLQKGMVICNEDHRFLVAENLKEIACDADIFLEPLGRNTAPAIAVAAFHAIETDNDSPLMVLPADHVIQDQENFEKAVSQAQEMAQQGYLVTFGIKPTSPHTGYGYIECGESIQNDVYNIASFRENRIWKQQTVSWGQAIISGTAVCLCLKRKAIWMN